MSSADEHSKENESKVKRISLDSPSQFDSPSTKFVPKKARRSMPLGVRLNEFCAGDENRRASASGAIITSDIKKGDGLKTSPTVENEGLRTPTNSPVSHSTSPFNTSVKDVIIEESFVKMPEDPHLDATAAEMTILEDSETQHDESGNLSLTPKNVLDITHEELSTPMVQQKNGGSDNTSVVVAEGDETTLNSTQPNVLDITHEELSTPMVQQKNGGSDNTSVVVAEGDETTLNSTQQNVLDITHEELSTPMVQQKNGGSDNTSVVVAEGDETTLNSTQPTAVEVPSSPLANGEELKDVDHKRVDYVPLAQDPFLDATADETKFGNDSIVSLTEIPLPPTEVEKVQNVEETLDESSSSDATIKDESPAKYPFESTHMNASMTRGFVLSTTPRGPSLFDELLKADGSHVKDSKDNYEQEHEHIEGTAMDTAEKEQDSESTPGVDTTPVSSPVEQPIGSADSYSPDISMLRERKRQVRASMAQPPCTPSGLVAYARDRLDDYSFRVNEAYCVEDRFCENCYSLRVELENVTDQLSKLSMEHGRCKMAQEVQQSLQCVGQLKSEFTTVTDELVRITTENEELKRKVADMTIAEQSLEELQQLRDAAETESERLRIDYAKLETTNRNLTKDLDDYKFVMEIEVKKRKKAADECRRQVVELETQLESHEDDEKLLEEAKAQLEEKFESDLAAAKQQMEAETIDARSLVDANSAMEIEKLRTEVVALSEQLTEERATREQVTLQLTTAQSQCEQLSSNINEQTSHLHTKNDQLQAQLAEREAEQSRLIETTDTERAELQQERDELKTRVNKLQEDLEGESETKDILEDALKASESERSGLAEQLVGLEEDRDMLRKRAVQLEEQIKLKDDTHIAELSSEVQRLQEEVNQLADVNKQLEEANECKERMITESQSTGSSLTEELNKLRTQLKSSEDEKTAMREAIQQKDLALERTTSQKEHLESESAHIEILQKEIDSLREQMTGADQRTAASVGEAIRAEFQRKKESRIEQLEGQIRELEETANGLKSTIRDMERDKEDKVRRCDQLQKEIDATRKTAEQSKTALQHQLDTAKTDFDSSLKATVAEWESRVAHWRGLSESKEQLFAELTDSIKTQAAQLVKASMEEKVELLEKRAVQSEAESAAMKEELAKTREEVHRESELVKEKEQTVIELRMEAGQLRTSIDSLTSQKTALETRIADALTELIALRSTTEQRIKETEDASTHHATELTTRIRGLEADIEKANDQNNDTLMELEILKKTAQTASTSENESTIKEDEEKEDMRRRMEMLESENERMGKCCDEADEEIESLKELVFLKEQKIASLEGLSPQETARRMGSIQASAEQPTVPMAAEVTVDSVIGDAGDEVDTSRRSIRMPKLSSPWKKNKSPKKAKKEEGEQSCRTQ